MTLDVASRLACGATTYDDELSEREDGWPNPEKGVDDGAKPSQQLTIVSQEVARNV